MAEQVQEEKALINPHIITYNMVHKIRCDEAETPAPVAKKTPGDGPDEIEVTWKCPRLMILFNGGDVNSAMHFLLNSVQNPFKPHAVASVLIEESALVDFTRRFEDVLEKLSPEVQNHPNFKRTLAVLAELKPKTIVAEPRLVPAGASPIFVYDMMHSYFGEGPTGVVTLHTFRTAKDATVVQNGDKVHYNTVSLWNEKLASVYELIALLKEKIFFVNCFEVDLEPIWESYEKDRNDAKIVKGYHYETLRIQDVRKIVVFPVGTIFAN